MTKIKHKNLQDQKFGRLLVLEEEVVFRSGRNRRFCKCVCDCGNECKVSVYSLKKGVTKSCGCLMRESRGEGGIRQSHSWKGHGNVSGSCFIFIKKAAEARNIVFQISAEYLDSIFNGKCNLSNIDISLPKFRRDVYKNHTASLDRIDPSVGYLEGNLQWLHQDVNKIKTNQNQDNFLSICNEIKKYHGSSFVFKKIHVPNRGGNWKGCGNISGSYWCKIKNHALSCNRDINISIEYIWDLFEKQGGKCRYTKRDLFFPQSVVNKNTQTASLDRIDSNKGYIKGNVQWVHKEVNQMKWNFPEKRFIELCTLVANNTIT
jgi:hypothetical protein